MRVMVVFIYWVYEIYFGEVVDKNVFFFNCSILIFVVKIKSIKFKIYIWVVVFLVYFKLGFKFLKGMNYGVFYS